MPIKNQPFNINLPNIGDATLNYISLNLLEEIERLLHEVDDDQKPQLFFANLISSIFINPKLSPNDIHELPQDTIDELISIANDQLDIEEEYSQINENQNKINRLYQAYLDYYKNLAEKLGSTISKNLFDFIEIDEISDNILNVHDDIKNLIPDVNSFENILKASDDLYSLIPDTNLSDHVMSEYQDLINSIPDTNLSENYLKVNDEVNESISFINHFEMYTDIVEKMGALNLKLSLPELPTKLIPEFDDSITKQILLNYDNISIQQIIKDITNKEISEPFYSDALRISELNSPEIHTLGYSLQYPIIRKSVSVNDSEIIEHVLQSRLVDAYDTLSELELNIRKLIEVTLEQKYGEKWWNKRVPNDIRENCASRKQKKEKPDDQSFHPIYYAHVFDYLKIIMRKDNWEEIFQPIFGNKIELEACFNWVVNVRDPIAHSRPISEDDHLMFIAGAKWILTRLKKLYKY